MTIQTKSEVAEYWEKRYKNDSTGWDMEKISPPLKAYFDQLEDKNIKMLIPGCGNAYEAEYLIRNNFTNVHVLDIAKQPLTNLKDRVNNSKALHLHNIDFFDFNGKFDLIIEQTFFCSLEPEYRIDYSDKIANLLKEDARLVGLLFDFPLKSGPPYGGNMHEYKTYFEPNFHFKTFQRCYNSYYKRHPKELFINLEKK